MFFLFNSTKNNFASTPLCASMTLNLHTSEQEENFLSQDIR